jgi:AraC-like DNA-binding protein
MPMTTTLLYQERAPLPALSTQVESVWFQRVPAGTNAFGQLVVPDGCTDLLWRAGRLRVAGPDTTWRIAELPPGSFIAGVRLRPGAARLLFGDIPVNEALDQELDLADLWDPRLVRELADRPGELDSPSQVAALLERAMVDRLPYAGELDPVIRAAVALLDVTEPPPLPVLASRFGFSERQLRRRFVAAVGYGPTTLAGVLRLRRALRLFEATPPHGRTRARPAEVAIAAGYADQPHLTREMRKLANVTPGKLAPEA